MEFFDTKSQEHLNYLKLIFNIKYNMGFTQSQVFYFHVLNNFDFVFVKDGNNYSFDVGLDITSKSLKMIINPVLLFEKPNIEITFRIIHELEHFLRKHMFVDIKDDVGITTTNLHGTGLVKKKVPISFLAMDLEINSLAYKSTDFILSYGIFPKKNVFSNFEPNLNHDEYYDLIVNNCDLSKEPFLKINNEYVINDILPSSDNYWVVNGNSNKLELEIEELIKTAGKKAGDVKPAHYNKFFTKTNVEKNWKHILNKTTKNIISEINEKTKRRLNKRGIAKNAILQGYKIKTEANILCAIDTSASMSTKDYVKILNHLIKMAKTSNIKMRFYCFDIDVHVDVELNKKTDIVNVIKDKVDRFTGGGTKFKPIFEKIKKDKLNLDLVVIFTDGYAEEITHEISGNNKLLWVLTPYHNAKLQNIGKITYI